MSDRKNVAKLTFRDTIWRILSFSCEVRIKEYKFRVDIWILLILLLSAFLGFYNITNRGIFGWDEGAYLNAGKHILEGDIRFLASGYKYVHNLIIAIFFAIFGVYDYVGFSASVVFGILTVYLTYLIGDKLFNRRIGLLAALILAVTEYFIYYSRTALADIHLTFFFTLTIFVYINNLFEQRKSNLLPPQ